jgi:predicted transcriptional regulator YheO
MTNIFKKVRTPAQTPFERERAKEIAKLYEQGINPLKVEIHTSADSYRYSYNDIANYMEQTGVPFALIQSAFTLRQTENKETPVVRQPVEV